MNGKEQAEAINAGFDKLDSAFALILAKIDEIDARLKRVEEALEGKE